MDDDTSLIINEFKTVSKQIEGLRVYNAQMKQQIERQEERLKEIDKTMKEAQVMQRQIPPFTRRMLSGVETSIELDLPFHLSENKSQKTVHSLNKFKTILNAFIN